MITQCLKLSSRVLVKRRLQHDLCRFYQATSWTSIIGDCQARIIRAYSASAINGQDNVPEDDFGDYSIILPPDPPIFGTSHITPLDVPAHIARPPYALLRVASNKTGLHEEETPSQSNDTEIDPYVTDPYSGDGRIELGSEDEACLRHAASLARDTLNVVERLIKVGALPPGSYI